MRSDVPLGAAGATGGHASYIRTGNAGLAFDQATWARFCAAVEQIVGTKLDPNAAAERLTERLEQIAGEE